MLDHHGEDDEMKDTIDQIKKVITKHHEKSKKAKKEDKEEDDEDEQKADDKDTKEILKLNKKLKTKAVEK